MIPYGKQHINDTDIQAVIEVLKSDWLTQGPAIPKFEKAVAKYCGVKSAVAVSNGTTALHLACRALELGPGDTLWTSPNTFVASANCALYCGANVDFVDIDPKTYNISISALAQKLSEAKKNNKLPKILIPVHFAGQCCDMAAIKELSQEYGFYIIEDACHAFGGRYLDMAIGSSHYSDMSVFSFHPVKIITTGEGGMITTNNSMLEKKLRILATHGITREQDDMQNSNNEPWYYEQIDLGYNYRMTDIQAILGLSQLTRVDEFVRKRRKLVANYNSALTNLPLFLPFEAEYNYSAYHLYVIKLCLKELRKNRLEIFNLLRAAGIGVNIHYIPVHLQPYYKRLGFKQGDFPEAEAYYAGAITLPLFPELAEANQNYIINKIKEIVQ